MPIKKRVGNPTNLTAAEVDGNFDQVEADIVAEAVARDAAIAVVAAAKADATALAGKQDTLVSASNIKTVNGTSLLGAGDVTVAPGATAFAGLTDKATVDLVATNAPLATALAAKAPLQAGALAASTTAAPNATAVINAIAALVASAPGVLDTLNELAAALANDPNFATTMTTALAGKADAAAMTTALAAKQTTLVSNTNLKTVNGTSLLGAGDVTVAPGATAFAGLTDKATVDLVAINPLLAASLAATVSAASNTGKIGRAADLTVGRAFASTDFGVGIIPINSASVLAFTMPTVASMGLASSGNVLPIQVMGAGIPTFAGLTAATTINGIAGPSTVLPLVGAPVRYGIYVFTQIGSSDAWALA